MKRFLTVAILSLTAAGACSISVGSKKGSSNNSGAQARPAPPPPAPPSGRWGYMPGGPTPPPNVRPLPAYDRAVNVAGLRALSVRGPCTPEEVAPGVWSDFDCTPPQPIRRARALSLAPVAKKSFTGSGGHVGAGDLLPPAIDQRQMGLTGPIKNQGAVGACTAFSLSSTMDNALRKAGTPDVVSPLHVWSKYGMPNMGIAGDETENESITSEQVWPYDPAKACKIMKLPVDNCGVAYQVAPGSANADPQLKAERSHADNSGRYLVTSIEQINTKPVDTHALRAVLAGGDAVWSAFWTNKTAWKSSSLEDGVLPHYTTTGQTGHAVTLVGYRQQGGEYQYLIHNSWGPKWGDNGYGWIRESTVKQHIRSAYRVRVNGGGGTNPNQPQPQSSGCPQGQVKDAVFGYCANACPSGSPPSAGVCLPSVPGIPGLPQPNQPPGQQPQQQQCPQGQGYDPMNATCANLCPNGAPPLGGLCLPPFGQ